ncbi:hypothetical protein OM076_22440 [Solirubrobacter ginsenosidimutans]|uniref:Uncharacterized protein n=1 Tax=Solirubrobacter ginsenosidimutans TaxID=490573 RepID=A0A9X3S221_9ACTN|nr:hypothetical protein [Solirubrobacter ginsenosidimutans]MDA0163049.1 hypothetical protein [Solirubrobacter ginsenosidimutans]
MKTAELARREQEEAVTAREPEASGPAPAPAENVLQWQRSAGNAAVSRQLGGASKARTAARKRRVPAADQALGRMLARTADRRAGVKERDPAAEVAETEPEPEETSALETEESDELETEEAAETEAPGEERPAPVGTKATLARKPPKTKAPPTLKVEPQTKFKAPSGGRKRTDVGVGEDVTFTSNLKGSWAASGGTPAAAVTNGKKFKWRAANRAASITVTVTAGTQTKTTTMNVIEPTIITANKLSEMSFKKGEQGAGMKLRFVYQPLNVSFGNMEVKEVSGPATSITGYYLTQPAKSLWHDSGDTFTRIGKNNKDTAVDTASNGGDAKPWSDGTFEWVIPNHFKTIDEGGDGKQFTTVTQAFTLLADGTITVSKGGQSVTRSP